ncbi:MAG TPA: metallophosphoesterase family protein [Gemmataceae bacterium]|jgi:hypothetical protein
MFVASRRAFLASSVAGLAAGRLLAADAPVGKIVDADKAVDGPTFHPDTLFLTWQRDPTTTMTVQWVGTAGETADTKVYFAPAKEGTPAAGAKAKDKSWPGVATTPKPYPMTDFKVYRAELTGLTPGTDYQFKIGKSSGVYRFRTAPAKATDAIAFVSGGDCGVNQHAVANNQQAARQDPLFALIGGDLAYENGKSAEISLGFLRNYSRHMVARDGRMIPMVACIGNHEVDGGYDKPREKAPFYYALFDGLFRDTGYAALDFGDYLSLVLLDSGHTSKIGGDQADWLERVLKARADHPNVFCVNHVPAYPSYRNYQGNTEKVGTGEGNRTHWVPLFEKYRVPVVLEHHDHTFKRTKPLIGGHVNSNGVLYLGDGSWGRLRNPKKPDELPYLAASSRDYHLSLHRIQGQERFHLALDEFGRVMDVARTGQRKAGIVTAG